MTSQLQIQSTAGPVATATLFRPGENCKEVARADRLGLLVDGDEYFRTFAESAVLAQRSILILAWDFDSRTVLAFGPNGESRITVGDLLNELVRRNPDLHVHLLIWDYPMIYALDRQFPPIYGVGWRPDRRIHIQYDSVIPVGACHHQKVVVIDDRVAFAGGLDLTSRRWDTCEHRAGDPRRAAAGAPYPPFHDTMMAVSGPAARALGDLARDRWRAATGEQLHPVDEMVGRRLRWRRRRAPTGDPWPASLAVAMENVEVAISRTAAKTETGPALHEVETLYLDIIRAARQVIYIENQYFTAHRLGEALAERLGEPDGPEVVVVIRLLSHGWLEGLSMETLRTGLICRLRAADRFGRFRVYYPHLAGLKDGECLDVHSKLMIVDDQILRIGSANFANRSMSFDTECDLTVEARGDRDRASAIVAFRNRLLAEHLGLPEAELEAAAGRREGTIATIESFAGRGGGEDRRTLKPLEVPADTSGAMGGIVKLADPEEVVPLDGLIGEFRPPAALGETGKTAWVPLIGIGLAIAALTALWRYSPLGAITDAGTVAKVVQAAADSPWTIPVLLLSYAAAPFVMFPRTVLTLFATMAFGPWIGFGLAMLGLQVATFASFLVGRKLDRGQVRRLAGKSLNRVSETLRMRGILAMTVLRLVPMAPFAVIGIVAGAARVRPLHVVIGTALGTLPGTLVATVLGDRLASIVSHPRAIDYWLFGGAIALAVAAGYLVRRKLLRFQLPATRA